MKLRSRATTYAELFGDESEHDFTALDTLIPHPVYGRNHWVSVLNPSESTFESIKPLLHEAHAIAVKRVVKRKTPSDGDA
jgi:predicted DNA-binding protein (MmcQ/YjbR family)